jgi:threonine dehydrogenase-like Zn-dependent dehydrogenase
MVRSRRHSPTGPRPPPRCWSAASSSRHGRTALPGPAPVRRFLSDLIDRIWTRQIDPDKVFDLELPLAEAAAGYTAMDERRAIKVLLRP